MAGRDGLYSVVEHLYGCSMSWLSDKSKQLASFAASAGMLVGAPPVAEGQSAPRPTYQPAPQLNLQAPVQNFFAIPNIAEFRNLGRLLDDRGNNRAEIGGARIDRKNYEAAIDFLVKNNTVLWGQTGDSFVIGSSAQPMNTGSGRSKNINNINYFSDPISAENFSRDAINAWNIVRPVLAEHAVKQGGLLYVYAGGINNTEPAANLMLDNVTLQKGGAAIAAMDGQIQRLANFNRAAARVNAQNDRLNGGNNGGGGGVDFVPAPTPAPPPAGKLDGSGNGDRTVVNAANIQYSINAITAIEEFKAAFKNPVVLRNPDGTGRTENIMDQIAKGLAEQRTIITPRIERAVQDLKKREDEIFANLGYWEAHLIALQARRLAREQIAFTEKGDKPAADRQHKAAQDVLNFGDYFVYQNNVNLSPYAKFSENFIDFQILQIQGERLNNRGRGR